MSTPHTVTLNWVASTDSVSGYNIYRGVSSGAETTKLNTALVTATTFTDSTPIIGQDFYEVKSVIFAPDGVTQVESLASNEVNVTVPVPLPAAPTGLVAKVN